MTKVKSGKKNIGISTILRILFISVCFVVMLIQIQEACAEKKKISGTYKWLLRLSNAKIPVTDSTEKGYIAAHNSVLKSTDPEWNNARLFSVQYTVSLKESIYRGFGVITHPGGDQTFIEFQDKLTFSGSDEAGEMEGAFTGGTGKFEGIRARWRLKWIWKRMTGGKVGEWEVEYF